LATDSCAISGCLTIDFYRDIVQQLKAWQARPPKLRAADGDDVPEAPSHEPPRFEQSDVREVGDATDPLAVADKQ
jgi:hypothetical protein